MHLALGKPKLPDRLSLRIVTEEIHNIIPAIEHRFHKPDFIDVPKIRETRSKFFNFGQDLHRRRIHVLAFKHQNAFVSLSLQEFRRLFFQGLSNDFIEINRHLLPS